MKVRSLSFLSLGFLLSLSLGGEAIPPLEEKKPEPLLQVEPSPSPKADLPQPIPLPPETNAKKERHSEVQHAAVKIRDRQEPLINRRVPIQESSNLGEKLLYTVKWGGVKVGTLTLSVWPTKIRIRDRMAIMLESRAESNDFFDVFYPVKSVVRSYVDAEDGRSYLFKRDLREGRYRANDRLQFEYDYRDEEGNHGPVSLYSKTEEGETVTKAPRPIPGPVQDSLSALYYLRHCPFEEIGATHRILLATRKRAYEVRVVALRFEPLTLPALGVFDCVVVRPESEEKGEGDGIANIKGTVTAWLEKNTRIPLMAEIEIPVGVVTVILTSSERSRLSEVARPISSSNP